MQEFGGTGVSDVFTEFVARETNSKKRTGRSGIELLAQILIFRQCSRKPETSPLLIPIERQSRVIQELARVQLGRMLSGEDCADNVRGQQRETE